MICRLSARPAVRLLLATFAVVPTIVHAQGGSAKKGIENRTAASPVAGQKRLALIFGNTNYDGQLFAVNLLHPKTVSLPVTLTAVAVPLPPSNESNTDGTKINPKDGAEMIRIPAGDFLMGDEDRSDNKRRTVNVPAYYIYKNLVTVEMYEKFCKATGRKMPPEPEYKSNKFNPGWSKRDHPIVNVSWNDAKAYCDWAGMKLPTEEQWEKAARGTQGNLYPWGNDFDRSKLWCSKLSPGDAGGTTRAGAFVSGASPYGVLDMAGNAWQWCEDWYDSSDKERVLRGASWFYEDAVVFRASFRGRYSPSDRGLYVSGFRAVSPGLP
ncbi:MAG: SUMF1/EgtB/PvdO family nonheme iron enzyme [Armatimonadetes bacterium]|nr:SUMF1/EgtB/PvdO family nonheme iron enzyme [Armatimonadota bacterium]